MRRYRRHKYVEGRAGSPRICRRCGLLVRDKAVATERSMLVHRSIRFPDHELFFALGRGISMPKCPETFDGWADRVRRPRFQAQPVEPAA